MKLMFIIAFYFVDASGFNSFRAQYEIISLRQPGKKDPGNNLLSLCLRKRFAYDYLKKIIYEFAIIVMGVT
jgi:hypothetical protein